MMRYNDRIHHMKDIAAQYHQICHFNFATVDVLRDIALLIHLTYMIKIDTRMINYQAIAIAVTSKMNVIYAILFWYEDGLGKIF